jgi:hypothetical protein
LQLKLLSRRLILTAVFLYGNKYKGNTGETTYLGKFTRTNAEIKLADI